MQNDFATVHSVRRLPVLAARTMLRGFAVCKPLANAGKTACFKVEKLCPLLFKRNALLFRPFSDDRIYKNNNPQTTFTMKLLYAMAVAAVCIPLASFLTSCGGSEASAPLSTDSITKRASTPDSMAVAVAVVDYPQFGKADVSDSVKSYINATLHSLFVDCNPDGSRHKSYPLYEGDFSNGEAMVDFYVNAYKNELAAMNTEKRIGYEHYVEIRKLCDTAGFTTYESTDYNYLGGAHGITTIIATTFDKANGQRIENPIDTTKVAELQKFFRSGLVSYFNKRDGKISEKDLKDRLFVESDTIPFPQYSPTLMPDGVRFIYQQYEIAPYSEGQPSFTIPYKDIESFLSGDAKNVVKSLTNGK